MKRLICLFSAILVSIILLSLSWSAPAPPAVVRADSGETVLADHTVCAQTKEALQTDIAAILSATPTETPTATATPTPTPRAECDFRAGCVETDGTHITTTIEVNNLQDTLLPATLLYFAVDGVVVRRAALSAMSTGGMATEFVVTTTLGLHELRGQVMDAAGGNIVYDTCYTTVGAVPPPTPDVREWYLNADGEVVMFERRRTQGDDNNTRISMMCGLPVVIIAILSFGLFVWVVAPWYQRRHGEDE